MINPTIIPVRLTDKDHLNDWIFNHAKEKEVHMVDFKGIMKMIYKDNPNTARVWDCSYTVRQEAK